MISADVEAVDVFKQSKKNWQYARVSKEQVGERKTPVLINIVVCKYLALFPLHLIGTYKHLQTQTHTLTADSHKYVFAILR